MMSYRCLKTQHSHTEFQIFLCPSPKQLLFWIVSQRMIPFSSISLSRPETRASVFIFPSCVPSPHIPNQIIPTIFLYFCVMNISQSFHTITMIFMQFIFPPQLFAIGDFLYSLALPSVVQVSLLQHGIQHALSSGPQPLVPFMSQLLSLTISPSCNEVLATLQMKNVLCFIPGILCTCFTLYGIAISSIILPSR